MRAILQRLKGEPALTRSAVLSLAALAATFGIDANIVWEIAGVVSPLVLGYTIRRKVTPTE